MLNGNLNGPGNLGLTGFASQFDDIRVARLQQMQHFNRLGPVDSVKRHGVTGREIHLASPFTLLLHFGIQCESERSKSRRDVNFVGRLAVFKKGKVRHLLRRRNSIEVRGDDCQPGLFQHFDGDRSTVHRDARPDN